MATIFEFTDYKEYVQRRVGALPRGGRGAYQRMAEAAQMQSSNLSQVMSGPKHLTLEQADAVADWLELGSGETDYFLLLVLHARAGTVALRRRLERRIREEQARQKELAHRVPATHQLSEAEKAVFYSNWYYSAIHVLTFIDSLRSVESLAQRLRLPRTLVQDVVRFLLDHGLLVQKDGKLLPGTTHTHLESSNPLISRHHANWRVKAMEAHPRLSRETELSYSGQMTLSQEDALQVRDLCLRLVESTRKIVDPSPSEAAYCLNLDWFALSE